MGNPVDDARVPQWDVADRMRKSLRTSGMSVQEMAGYLGVARTSVSNWINGRVSPSNPVLRLWALRTGVSYEWLAGDRADPDGRGGTRHAALRGLVAIATAVPAAAAVIGTLAALGLPLDGV